MLLSWLQLRVFIPINLDWAGDLNRKGLKARIWKFLNFLTASWTRCRYSHHSRSLISYPKENASQSVDFVLLRNKFSKSKRSSHNITDFSIYDAGDILKVGTGPFLEMLSLYLNDPDSYYYRFTQMPIGKWSPCPSGLDQYQLHKSAKLYWPTKSCKWFFIKELWNRWNLLKK